MARGPIHTVILLLICLCWTAGSGSPRSWAQSGQSATKRPAANENGKSLAARLQSLRRSFQAKESADEDDQATAAREQQSRKKQMASSKQAAAKNRQSRQSSQKQAGQSKSAKTKSTKPLLSGFHAENLIRSGFFFKGKRQSKEEAQSRESSNQNQSKNNRGPSAKSRSTRHNNPQNQSGHDLSAARALQKPTAKEQLRNARPSPKLRSKQSELDSALAELVDDRQEIPSELLDITPPNAADSRPLPGFLGEQIAAESTEPDSRQTDKRLMTDRSERRLSSSVPAPLTRNGVRQTASGPSRSLDLREVLLSKSLQDNPTATGNGSNLSAPVARPIEPAANGNVAEPSDSIANSNEPSRHSNVTDMNGSGADSNEPSRHGNVADMNGSGPDFNEPSRHGNVADMNGSVADSKKPLTHFTQPMAEQDEAEQRPFEIPSTNERSGQRAAARAESAEEPLDDPSEEFAQARNHLRSQPDENLESHLATEDVDTPTNQERETRNTEQPLAIREREGRQQQVLLTTRQPIIVSRVEGPQKILVGRESQYHVNLRNQGGVAADQLTAKIHVPVWAEIVDATSTSGTVQQAESLIVEQAKPGAEEEQQILQWHLSQLQPEEAQTLHLRLIPRSGQPMHLGVNWTHAPVRSRTVVEVQEPKLRMTLSGPTDVLYGKAQRYRLVLNNPGTGVAEDVTIHLLPPGGSAGSETNHSIGSLEPRATKVVELELTARQAGELEVKATAIAAGNLRTETVKKVYCRKAELALDWRGPETKYAGTDSTYYFRVRNPGSALTDPLIVKVQLPSGARLSGASDGQSYDAKKNCVTWQLAGLSPKEEQFMQLQCKLNKPGPNSMQLTAETVAGDLSDMKTIQTNVVAIADLKLTVADPKGPFPVGETAIYEIRVTNRGTNRAENIQIVALFSEGIEPTEAEGNQYTIRDGRVSFKPIRNIAAGAEVVMEIHAQASQPGTHVFRAEVVCQELDIKLAAEETTRFFQDNWAGGKTPYTAGLEKTDETQQR
jgi:uncharacterized repeat protein (TIGR01451 family)